MMMTRRAGKELRRESFFFVDETLLIVVVHKSYRNFLVDVNMCFLNKAEQEKGVLRFLQQDQGRQ